MVHGLCCIKNFFEINSMPVYLFWQQENKSRPEPLLPLAKECSFQIRMIRTAKEAEGNTGAWLQERMQNLVSFQPLCEVVLSSYW